VVNPTPCGVFATTPYIGQDRAGQDRVWYAVLPCVVCGAPLLTFSHHTQAHVIAAASNVQIRNSNSSGSASSSKTQLQKGAELGGGIAA
jgi:hypothetical protein